MDLWVPNRSRAINNSPISCGRVDSDVAGRTSVKVRVRIGEPGALWFWYRAIGRHACSTRPREYRWDEEMRSCVFI